MARRIEGTVAGGFVCDADNCGLNAIWAIVVATPYKGQRRPPIITMTDVHVCAHHWSAGRRDMTTDHMREAIRRVAADNNGEPDFDRQWLVRISVYAPDYHRFQEMAGLISVGDMVIKSDTVLH